MDANATGGGQLTTRPLKFSGEHLFVNVAAPQGELREGAYIELHLTKAQNWLVAWRSLSDPVDPSTARVCDTAMRALDDQRRRLHPHPRAA